jgi:hypothetical protein
MLTLLLKAFYEISKNLTHEWDRLIKKVGKRTADTLLVFLALALILETFWFTLILSMLGLAYFFR